VLHAGADKVSVNTPALERPALISELAEAFGVQCVVVGIDSRSRRRMARAQPHRRSGCTRAWRAHAGLGRRGAALGAGEIVLNCMGSATACATGYDLEQLRAVRAVCEVPLVASGGAGEVAHFVDVFQQADVDGRAGRQRLPFGHMRIPELKQALARRHRGAKWRLTLCVAFDGFPVEGWTGTSRTACCPPSCRTPTPCAC
jgi:cyclase